MSDQLKPQPAWQIDEFGDVFRTNRDSNGHYGRVGYHPVQMQMKMPCHWGCFPHSYANPRGFVSGDCASIEEGKQLVEAAFNAVWADKNESEANIS